jgi:cell division septal protein FtsQ
MRLKPQPRARTVPRRGASRSGARRGAARPRNRMARRPGVPLRRRIGGRLPSLGRVLAVLGAAAGIAGLVALVSGPWLRVSDVAWEGDRYTPPRALELALADERGSALLAVDTTALGDRIEEIPSVVEARVAVHLTGALTATVVEHVPAFVWETPRVRLVGAEDGTLFAAIARDGAVPDELAELPTVGDERREARVLAVGDRIPAALLRTATALSRLDPVALGSEARRFTIAVDDAHGFRLHAAEPGWEVAFGVYGLDPRETVIGADARLERQVTAVRTLFASHSEAEIGWVDVRNPGKVYFRAKG